MKTFTTRALRWLLILGTVVLWPQPGAARVFAFVSKAWHTPAEYRQSDTSKSDLTCEEASKNAGAIKTGMREAEVLELLGTPQTRLENEWVYNFWRCTTRPRVGEQKIIGLDIIFSEGAVKEIKYATIDAIGPAPNSVPAKKKNRKRSSQ